MTPLEQASADYRAAKKEIEAEHKAAVDPLLQRRRERKADARRAFKEARAKAFEVD